MLDSKQFTQNQRNAITYTLYERKALMDLGQLTDRIMEALMQQPQVSIEMLKGKLGEHPLLDRYITEDLIPILTKEKEW